MDAILSFDEVASASLDFCDMMFSRLNRSALFVDVSLRTIAFCATSAKPVFNAHLFARKPVDVGCELLQLRIHSADTAVDGRDFARTLEKSRPLLFELSSAGLNFGRQLVDV